MNKRYKYNLRPAYGSEELLLEFFLGTSDSEFVEELLKTLSDINAKIDRVEDIWQNDEMLFHMSSNNGEFLLSKDIWGFAFITAEKNQTCIIFIDQVLEKSNKFEKEIVDFSKYKI